NYRTEDFPGGPAVISPDGKWVAVAGNRNNRTFLFNRETGKQVRTFGGVGRQPSVVAWVKDKDKDIRKLAWRTTLVGADGVSTYEPDKPLQEKFFEHAFRLDELRPLPPPPGKDDVFQRNRFGNGTVHLRGVKDTVDLVKGKTVTATLELPGHGFIDWNATSFAGPEHAVVSTGRHFHLFEVSADGKGKRLPPLRGFQGEVISVASSPDKGRYLLT